MADINKEIQDFAEAEYGEEVRSSLINLARKVNSEVEKGTADVAAQVQIIQNTNTRVNEVAQVADDAVERSIQTMDRADEVLDDATGQASAAAGSAVLSQSWSSGGTGVRPGEDTDNSKYHSQRSETEAARAKQEADRASMYANFVTPEFMIIDNQVYIKEKSTADFKLYENRIYMKLPA